MKKLLFVLIACLTVLSVKAKTAYFLNDDSWESIYAYAWNDDNDKNANWPGIPLGDNTNTREVDGKSYYYYECDYANIIFNAGNGKPQTKNLEDFSDGAVYSATNNNNSNGSIDQIGTITKQPDGSYTFTKAGEVPLTEGKLYFPVSSYNKSKAYLYTWDSLVAGGWPGTQLTRETINNIDFWVFTTKDDREITKKTFQGVQLNTGDNLAEVALNDVGPIYPGYYIHIQTGDFGPLSEYQEETSRDKVLYVVGEATNWLDNKIKMDHVEGTNVWTLTSDTAFSKEWKICDGTWDWDFGMGNTLEPDQDNDVWWKSGNFNPIPGNVSIKFTLAEGSDVDNTNIPSKLYFTTDTDIPKIAYLKGTFNKWEDNYAYYIDEDNKVAAWDRVQLFAVPEGANEEEKGQIKVHSFDGWFGSKEPLKLNTWTDCYVAGEGENNNIVIEDDSANENKLYLVKFDTELHQIWVEAYDFYLIFEDGELNRSYKFYASSEEEGAYVLEVASIKANKEFYITSTHGRTFGLSKDNKDEGVVEAGKETNSGNVHNYVLVEDGVSMKFNESYANLTFTFYPGGPTLKIDGTKVDDFDDIAISFGNDKTMQSGKLSDSDSDDLDGHIHIDVVETNTGALIYVHSPKDKDGTPLTVYHKITMVDAQNVNRRAAAPEGYTAATFNEDYQAHQVALPVGEGTVSLNYEGNPDEAKTYSFEVVQSTPLGVDGIEAEEGEAEYFTLQGVKVANPEKGIYIKVVGGKAVKVVR